jgi:lipoprotein signal peptidase
VTILLLTFAVVLVTDQTVKLVLLCAGRPNIVSGRLWLSRFGNPGPMAIWCVWTIGALPLLAASIWLPSASAFVGLVLGGSSSNALEASVRGIVSDYLCLRFCPSFNLADLALTVGAVGTVGELVIAFRA